MVLAERFIYCRGFKMVVAADGGRVAGGGFVHSYSMNCGSIYVSVFHCGM